MILGLHCAVNRGFEAALERAKATGIGVMQMLPYPRHHAPTPEELERFRVAREAAGIRLVSHSRFVPSLASSDEKRRGVSVRLLARELDLARAQGAESFVIHAGAWSPGSTHDDGIALFGRSVREAREGRHLRFLIENVPGGGRRLGGTLEELARLAEAAGPDDGFCLDTAHAWAAGYDVSTAEGALKFLSKVHRILGSERVGAFHLNGSRALLGSHRENHAAWSDGYLRPEALKVFLERPEYERVPGILEVPRADEEAGLELARAL